MIELDLRRCRTGALARAETSAGLASARFRTDDPYLWAAFRSIFETLRREIDERHRGHYPAPTTFDLPAGTPADNRRLADVLGGIAANAATPDEQEMYGALAASVRELAA